MDGYFAKIIDRRFKGDAHYASVYPHVSIGGLMLSRETIPVEFIRPVNAELEYALLEIGVLTPHTSIDWRVKVNGINVTKEFKPLATTKIGDKLYAKLLYDITSILNTPESMKKRRANVTFKREGGEPIIVDQISILALYSSSEADAWIKYYSGALGLEPGESKRIEIGDSIKNPILRSTIHIPSRMIKAKISIDNSYEITLSNRQGLYEVVEELDKLNRVNFIEYIYEEEEQGGSQRLGISNLLLYRVEYVEPEIVVDESTIPEKIRRGDAVKLKLVNKGESRPDNLLLVVMSLGNIVASQKLKPLEPGEEAEATAKIDLQPGEYELVFRVVWRKLSKTWFKEYRRRINIV